MGYGPRGEMTPEVREFRRVRDKRNHYLRETGRGGWVDTAPIRSRLRQLHYRGATFERLSEVIGIDLTMVKRHYYGGWYEKCQWQTANAILTARFTEGDFEFPFAAGSRRRMQALICAGFPQSFLADASDWTLAYLNKFVVQVRPRTTPEVRDRCLTLWDKFKDADPTELGIPSRPQAYAKTVARKRSFAPAVCWDEDTIDDPEAVPQWTGACGTAEGRAIHRREDIPMCAACRSPKDDSFSYGVFSPKRLLDKQKHTRMSRRGLADAALLSPATVQSYILGFRVPPTSTLERLADALRCRPEDLCE